MMTTKTIAFISDIHIGPWVVPQKVQTSFTSSYMKEKEINISFIFSIPNCDEYIVFPDLSKFGSIVLFSRWQLPLISRHFNSYFQESDYSEDKTLYFALENARCDFNSESVLEQLQIIKLFSDMSKSKS